MASRDEIADAAPARPGGRGGPGRPRRYGEAEELELIFKAAFRAVERKGYPEVTVADVLSEAGVARRSFYRHFDSKDELITAMIRREAELFSAAVTAAVRAAPEPGAALLVWVDEILALAFSPPRARRARVFAASSVPHPPEEAQRTYGPLVALLAETLRAGVAGGVFVSPRPDADARLISAATWETLGLVRREFDEEVRQRMRTDLLSFVRRALAFAP
ncbi:TetR/AcrR family transcriptional regulator [Actinocorallia sp. API 0066]|uniref:TetR/AcrR family transcriptional regulator n=1 Tax=Actinocorallia sp. API 0066 TaxID=2896846 RepID=UPI001E37D282|nr:TetR/AcrR family transcriptional regulator [Actinocorallia sp. API 0066]MCD0448932.1 TetR/AcrR family transcriptional regulator [Actinocorallia sp. API 0066]